MIESGNYRLVAKLPSQYVTKSVHPPNPRWTVERQVR